MYIQFVWCYCCRAQLNLVAVGRVVAAAIWVFMLQANFFILNATKCKYSCVLCGGSSTLSVLAAMTGIRLAENFSKVFKFIYFLFWVSKMSLPSFIQSSLHCARMLPVKFSKFIFICNVFARKIFIPNV